jgi:hypothetical protein
MLFATGYIYPALLTALVPLRSRVLSKLFSEKDLKYLDPSSATEREHEEEQRAFRMLRNDSFDLNEDLPHFGQFHPDAIKNALRHRKSSRDSSDFVSAPA